MKKSAGSFSGAFFIFREILYHLNTKRGGGVRVAMPPAHPLPSQLLR
jgi:hypothetical protein